MSNEEIVLKIQSGERDCMGQLWEQVAGLVKWKANRIMTALGGSVCAEFDDLFNSGYIAMARAVDTYDPERGSFSTWFMLHLKTVFAETTGYRTRQGQNEPLRGALSLSTPVGDDKNDWTLGEIIPDPAGATRMDAIEESEYQRELQQAMEKVLAELPEQHREVIQRRYYLGQTLQEAAEGLQISAARVAQREKKALRHIRQLDTACELIPFYDFDYYSGVSLGAFKNSGMTVQERYLINCEKETATWRKKRDEEMQARIKEIGISAFMAEIRNKHEIFCE